MRAETYAVVNLAALNLIEATSAAYYATEKDAAARHEFRVKEMLKKIAAALGYEIAEPAQVVQHRADAERPTTGQAESRPPSPRLRLVADGDVT